jgi:hypothetical protein
MTLEQFNSLDEEKQANALWDGIYKGVRMEGNLRVALYELGEFHVEVFYSPDLNKIVRYNAFGGEPIL